MKMTAIVLGLVISSTTFSATILNGITLSGLPTASKSYYKSLNNSTEITDVKVTMEGTCKFDKAAAEALLLKTGSKILASEGCSVNVTDDSYCDQGGCGNGIVVDTKFEITFK